MKNLYYLRRGSILLWITLLLMHTAVLAQDRTITGRITSKGEGSALPGVNVSIKGTSRGVVSDANGGYSIVAPARTTLVYSFIGFKAQEVVVGNQSVINVALSEDVSTLNEVVVTGYSAQSKRDITGAVSTVNTKELLSIPATDVAQQLQGRVAGVTVTNDATPGGSATVRIRGFGTIGNNDPLYIIDGVPTQNLGTINQNDIETIQVLKDASASSIYGSRAANGVVIVTTKKGKAGVSRITFDAYYGSQQWAKKGEVLNATELGQYLYLADVNAGKTPSHGQYTYGATGQVTVPAYVFPSKGAEGTAAVDPSKYSLTPDNIYAITRSANTNWFDEVSRVAPIQNYQLGATGGSETGRYALSVGYFNQQGTVRDIGYDRYSIRANTEFNVKKRIRVGENLTAAYSSRKGGFNNNEEQNAVSGSYKHHPLLPVYDIAGNFAGSRGLNLGNNSNPVATLFRERDNRYNSLRVFGNAYAEVDIIEGLTARTSMGLDANGDRAKYLGRANPEYIEGSFNNSLTDQNRYFYQWVWTNTLNYSKTFKNVHKVDAFVGTEAIRQYQEFFGAARSGYFTEQKDIQSYLDLGTQSSASNEGRIEQDYSLFSVFGKLNYAYSDKYLFQAIIRQDKSSRFLSASNSALFPAVSAGWRISQEDFFKNNLTFVSDMKLRAGWGKTGNQAIGDYNAYTTYRSNTSTNGYPIDGSMSTATAGFSPQRFGNPNAKWEATASTNFGFDLAMLSNKLDVSFDVWSRKTTDMLFTSPFTFTAGDADIPAYNVGSMQNRGIDLAIGYKDRKGDFRYGASINFATYRNKVLKLDESDNTRYFGYGSRVPAVTLTQAGLPISSFFGYQVLGIFQTAEEAKAWAPYSDYNAVGKFKMADVNGDGKIDDADRTVIGSPHPDFTYGINLNLGYKNFDLTIFGNGSQGNKIYNYTRYFTDFNTFQGNRSRRSLYDAWSKSNPGGTVPIPDANDQISSRPSSYFIEDGSYFRIKNVQLGYTLPAGLLSKLGLSSCQVYVQSQNLLTFTKYQGLNPEISISNNFNGDRNRNLGFDGGYLPASRTLLFGLSVGF
ncbi:SusC/RagA family TonB-linked outer membrane protein [Spirosoma fluviale]|uniref:TonB-linked outer membrane protein, SusC/RagA family n=1 Tax=Spirosoma fluviale TaxID=1597977 RepID=A0A286FGV3_9BACT|nr:TonB-dependent receptor [Spirosoma fluviale]SOD82450.1 TonB-linked outer membrane protein, SusC/RagA family [Spirosoma fluviale]